MSDEDWQALQDAAWQRRLSTSQLVRQAIGQTTRGSTGPQLTATAPPTPQSPSPELHAAFLRVAQLTAEGRKAAILDLFTAAPEYQAWAKSQKST